MSGLTRILSLFLLLGLLWFVTASRPAAAQTGTGETLLPPQGPARSMDNSVGHAHDFEARLMGPAGPQANIAERTDCSARAIVGLSPAALVRYLRSQPFSCLRFLWTYNKAVASVLDAGHLQAVYRAIAATAGRKQERLDPSLENLLFFVRIGHYHAFYQHFAFDPSVAQAAVAAFDALKPQVARAVGGPGATPPAWLLQWMNAVDGADLAHRYLPELKNLLRAFIRTPERRNNAAQQRNAYSALTVISRHIGNRSQPFVGAVDADLIQILTRIALHADLLDNADYVLNAAVWALGRIGPLKPHQGAVVQALQQITEAYEPTPALPTYRSPYLWVLQALDQYLHCPIGDIHVCRSDLVGKLESQLFPHRYRFDDGAMVFETSLSLEEVQPLYYAAKEVASQFSRITGALAPVKDDPNCILRVKIYGSKEAFSNYHWFLYNLPTDNGGIYIEQNGVFYTFQRTKEQSRYSLEELFRHEYVHYLVGRYLIAGFWGQVPLYQRGRMVWFDEGFAEFLTWASAATGVRIRRSLVAQVARDRERLDIRQVMQSRYGDFKFYRYAGLLFNYLYAHDPTMLRRLVASLKTADTGGLDKLMAQLSGDRKLEHAYQQFLDEQVAHQNRLTNPQTFFPEVDLLDLDDVVAIETEFKRTMGGGDAECHVASHTINRRFACRDEFVGPLMPAADYEAAWQDFDRRLDATISALSTSGRPNNFQAMNCYMGPIRFRSSRGHAVYPVAAVYCEGPLASRPTLPVDPVVQLVRDFQQSVPNLETECAVAPDSRVECSVVVTTQLYGADAADPVLDQELNLLVSEVANQIYASRPSLYGSLTCSEVGDREAVAVDPRTRYEKTRVNCVVELCPCAAVSVDPQSLASL